MAKKESKKVKFMIVKYTHLGNCYFVIFLLVMYSGNSVAFNTGVPR